MVPNFCEPQLKKLFLQFAHVELVDSTCEVSKEGCKGVNVCNFTKIDSMCMYSGLPVCYMKTTPARVQFRMFLTHV